LSIRMNVSFYFLPRMGMPYNDHRVLGFQNHWSNWFADGGLNIARHWKYSSSASLIRTSNIGLIE
jgi:hypothetical protein